MYTKVSGPSFLCDIWNGYTVARVGLWLGFGARTDGITMYISTILGLLATALGIVTTNPEKTGPCTMC